MALTTDQTVLYSVKLGTDVDLVDMEARYARLQDDDEVIAEVREQRLNDLLLQPASFSIPGEYAETQNTKAIDLLVRATGSTVRIVPVESPCSLDTEEMWVRRRRYGGR